MTELDAAYERAKTNIVRQEEDKRYQIRSQYGLVSMKEQYEKDMKTLKEQYRQGLLNEKEYQQAKLKIKTDYLKRVLTHIPICSQEQYLLCKRLRSQI